MAAGERFAERARQGAALAVLAIAGTMLAAWLAGLQVATRADTLAPMTPLACAAFLGAAAGVWGLPDRRGLSLAGGACAWLAGAAGLADALIADGGTLNRAVFGADARISHMTALALLALGAAIALDARQWPVTRWLTLAAGAVSGAAAIGFLLGVPLFYGRTRPVEMSWQAALCGLLATVGIVSAHPAGPLFADGMTGRFARRTLPGALAIPVASGAFAAAAARAG